MREGTSDSKFGDGTTAERERERESASGKRREKKATLKREKCYI